MTGLQAPSVDDRRAVHPARWGVALIATAITVTIGALLLAIGISGVGTNTTNDTTSAVAPSALGGSSAAVTLTDVSDIAAEVVDSVVSVEVTTTVRAFRGAQEVAGSGSGVIVDSDGTIVTNAHVVEDADDVIVVLADGTEYRATVLALDTAQDVAVMHIDATGLNAIELGSTENLLVGDPVIAVGYPLALTGGPSVSTGIVSALDRVLDESDVSLEGVLQTDAAITEGSSGGALLDATGRLIGITTAVGVSRVGVEGIGFAIPVETIASVLAQRS